MAGDSDKLVDRRRLKRHLAAWRVIALVALVAVVAVAVGRFAPLGGGPYVAAVAIDGFIFDDPDLIRAIRDVAKDDDAQALIVRIDSPGGGTFASEALYHAIKAVAEEKPTVAVMGEVAASGGYMAAIATEHIVARESTITGSIGVIMEATNIVGLMEMIGIETEAIRSGPLKALPNPFERMTPEAREATQAVIDEVFEMFVTMVADARGFTRAEALAVADGRVFAGAAARGRGLVDALGDEDTARRWLAEVHDVGDDLPVREVRVDDDTSLVDQLVEAVVGKSYLSERLILDGLVSVWHPALMFPN